MANTLNLCAPCLRENKNSTANVYCLYCSEMMCGNCKQQHMKFSSLVNHKWRDIGENDDPCEFDVMKNMVRCPDHELEEVKYLCKDHDHLCCNTCAIAAHRKCERVVSLADEMKTFGANEGIARTLKEIDKHTDELLDHELKYQASTKSSIDNVQDVLEKFKIEIDEAYEKLEKNILLEVSQMGDNMIKRSLKNQTVLGEFKTTTNMLLDKVKFVSKYGKDEHKYLINRELKNDVRVKDITIKQLHMDASNTFIKLTASDLREGIIQSVTTAFRTSEATGLTCNLPPCPGCKDFTERQAVIIKEDSIPEEECDPKFCVWIGEYILISVQSKNKLILYDTSNGTLLATYPYIAPLEITVLDGSNFAVCSGRQDIDVMKIEESQFQQLQTIRNVSNVYALAYNPKHRKIIGLLRDMETLTFVNSDYSIADSVKLDSVAGVIAKGAYNIKFDNALQRLYIASFSNSLCKLCAVDLNGSTLFEYTHADLSYPWSIAVDCDSNIYVSSNIGHCIQQLSKDGKYVRNAIPTSIGMKNPLGICFNSLMTRIAVTCKERGKEIRIFKFE